MRHWSDLRRRAAEQYSRLLSEAGGEHAAHALLAAAARVTGIVPEPVPTADPLLQGCLALLDPEAQAIFYDAGTDPVLVPLHVAHEYAHLWLGHEGHHHCSATDLDVEAAEEPVPLGVHRVKGYGPEERREREANVFARELLLPSEVLRGWYREERLSASEIARRVGVPLGVVYHQLTHALLTPSLPAQIGGEAGHPAAIPELDGSQREAARVEQGPTLVEAGPGTGKTRALVGRILVLLERGVAPESILCLTFSNKAAEEMRERVAQVAPDAARRLTMGTFHAFGLEILRRWGPRLGLPPRPTVLDPADVLLLLERSLPDLGLRHYQNLYEPTVYLRDILSSISRAKDELCGPAEYQALAEGMRAAATTEEEVEAAEKAAEVAGIYSFYQAHLEHEGLLDFGDLLYRTVVLLRKHSDVCAELRTRYTHVLVDEYQDVNRVSGLLLKEIAGDGRGLWVVGDTRQSIYRWRGASTANMRLFADDFPGADVKVLGTNYRSQRAVVDVVAELAPRMRATVGRRFTPWDVARPTAGGAVRMEVAEDETSEAEGIAAAIEDLRRGGVAYSDQAVLCRSHATLERLALHLERAGVPVLYLGDLFERPEIRDLLSLLSLACHGDGRGLLRVARFPEYRAPLADVRALLAAAAERDAAFPGAMELADDLEGLSARGREGFRRLTAHLDQLCYGTEAWGLLVRYLFDRSGYLTPLLADESTAGQQQRLALYQFLQFAHQQRGHPSVTGREDPKRAFLRHVRRLQVFGEEKQLRQVPEWASGIDAVRMLTIHASKGLEFSAVFVPVLAAGTFPVSARTGSCPPPPGMIQAAPADPKEEQAEEEECLFFVALSRARDVLCLSRPAFTWRRSNPSSLLALVEHALPRSPSGSITWPARRPAPPATAAPLPPAPGAFDVNQLEIYLRCPRQYLYEVEIGLSGRREDSAYVLFHRCVYHVLRWLQAEHAAGRPVTLGIALDKLEEAWQRFGPTDHAYAAMYRASAEQMVERLLVDILDGGAPLERPEWEVSLPNGRVRLIPDHVTEGDAEAPTVIRLRTGRASKSELAKPIYGLYQAAVEQHYPGRPPAVRVFSLSTGEQETVTLKPGPLSTRLGKYDEAIAGILRGSFPPKPDDRQCPRCPHYFICPAAEDA